MKSIDTSIGVIKPQLSENIFLKQLVNEKCVKEKYAPVNADITLNLKQGYNYRRVAICEVF